MPASVIMLKSPRACSRVRVSDRVCGSPYPLLILQRPHMLLPCCLPFCLILQETEEERSLRTRVFVQGAFHWSVSLIGYCILFIIGCIAIPHVFSPVKVCAEVTSVFALPWLPVPDFLWTNAPQRLYAMPCVEPLSVNH